jgi:hypothetical protein
MVANINNFGVVNFYESNAPKNDPSRQSEPACEDIEPVEEPSSFSSECHSDIPDSIIFTKKAKQEGKQQLIISTLQRSVLGRRDKTRAFVHELQEWQKEGYVDARFNAQVMYDELDKIMPLTFGYEAFKKYYNNTRS